MPREPELDEIEVTVVNDDPDNKQYCFGLADGRAAWFPKSEVSFKRRNVITGKAVAEIPMWLLKDRGWDLKPVDPAADMPDESCPDCEGTGEVPSLGVTPIEPTQPCPACGGYGGVPSEMSGPDGLPVSWFECDCSLAPQGDP